jgi:hypothetical protein
MLAAYLSLDAFERTNHLYDLSCSLVAKGYYNESDNE